MADKYFGSLEYSITKGFRDKKIMNIYIDHRLQTYTHLKEGDRISMAYNFAMGNGMIFKVKNDLPPEFLKTENPKLRFSSNNKNGKLTTWFDLHSKFRAFIMLPIDKIGQQPLKVTNADNGFIYFNSGRPRTWEDAMQDWLTLKVNANELNENELKIAQDLIYKLQRGYKLNDLENI